MRSTRVNACPAILVCFALSIGLTIYLLNSSMMLDPRDREIKAFTSSTEEPLWQKTLNFDRLNFTNETGNPSGCYIVPNYIHYVYLGGKPITYIELICILSAYKNQNPEKIFFHYNNITTFTGNYWQILMELPQFKEIVHLNKVKLPTKIYGQPLNKGWRSWHGSDILRIKMTIKYGGVFLDNDVYLIKTIDSFRRFEMTINWDDNQFLGTQVIIAHKDARFLKKWLECYKEYDGSKWYYNAGEKPTIEVLYKEPHLIHRVKVLFGADSKYIHNLFQMQWHGWKDFYTIHLLARHQYLLKSLGKTATYPVIFNETNIAYYPITFRDMAYDVYDIANITWPRYRFDK